MNRTMLSVISVAALMGASAHADMQRHQQKLQVVQQQAGFEQCYGAEKFQGQKVVTQRFACGNGQTQQGWIDYTYQVDQAGKSGDAVDAKIYVNGSKQPIVVPLGEQQAPVQQAPKGDAAQAAQQGQVPVQQAPKGDAGQAAQQEQVPVQQAPKGDAGQAAQQEQVPVQQAPKGDAGQVTQQQQGQIPVQQAPKGGQVVQEQTQQQGQKSPEQGKGGKGGKVEKDEDDCFLHKMFGIGKHDRDHKRSRGKKS